MNGRGFSLIELIVVMVIVATLLGVVAPLTVSQITKSKDHVELLSLSTLIEDISHQAYFSGQSIVLNFEKSSLQIVKQDGMSTLNFDTLEFPVQTITVNSNGFSFDTAVKVIYRGKPQTLRLNYEG